MTKYEMIASVRNNICEPKSLFWTDCEIGENLEQAYRTIGTLLPKIKDNPFDSNPGITNDIDFGICNSMQDSVMNYATYITLLKDNEQIDKALSYIMPAVMSSLKFQDKPKETLEALKECLIAIKDLRKAITNTELNRKILKRCLLEGCRYDETSPDICIYCGERKKVIPCHTDLGNLKVENIRNMEKCPHRYIKAFVTISNISPMSVTTCSHDNEDRLCLKCPDCGEYVTWEEREKMRNER